MQYIAMVIAIALLSLAVLAVYAVRSLQPYGGFRRWLPAFAERHGWHMDHKVLRDLVRTVLILVLVAAVAGAVLMFV